MEKNKVSYIQADENTLINEKSITWVKKINDCLEVCTKTTGCNVLYVDKDDTIKKDTHKICKKNNPDSYDKMNNLFK
jgi:hypothetical protein